MASSRDQYSLNEEGIPTVPVTDLLWAEHHDRRPANEPFLQPHNVGDDLWAQYVQALTHKMQKSYYRRKKDHPPLEIKERNILSKVSIFFVRTINITY